MRRTNSPGALIFCALCVSGLPALSPAGVTSYSVGRYISYSQTSDAPPTTPEFWHLVAVAVSDAPNEMASASLSFNAPGPVSYPMSPGIPTMRLYISSIFTDAPTYMSSFPATNFTITVHRGFGPETGSVVLVEDNFCADIPALTGDTFSRLQVCDPSQDFHGTIGGFTPAAGTNLSYAYVNVVPDGGPGAIWSALLTPTETDFTIPAGTLVPNQGYSMGIHYQNVTETSGAGFGGVATSGAEFQRATSVIFSTVPPPCGPTLSDQPMSISLDAGQTALFAVGATGDGALTFQWKKDGNPVGNGPTGLGSVIAGASGPVLMISAVHTGDAGDYSCTVTDTCGPTVSDSAALTINPTTCPADLDDGSGTATPDGGVDINDLLFFLQHFEAGC